MTGFLCGRTFARRAAERLKIRILAGAPGQRVREAEKWDERRKAEQGKGRERMKRAPVLLTAQ
jgi:hypothetical protein